MDLTAVKILSGVAGVQAIEAVSSVPIDVYEKFGIIGLLIFAVYALWLADQKRQTKLENIIKENTRALTEVRDILRMCARRVGEAT